MGNILISGTDDLLGVYLAANRLAFTPCHLFYLAHPASDVTAQEILEMSGWWIRRSASKPACVEREHFAQRLQVITGDQDKLVRAVSQSGAGANVKEAWRLDTGCDHQAPKDVRREELRSFAALPANLSVKNLNYVCGLDQPGSPEELARAVGLAGTPGGVRIRIFRRAYLLAEHWPISGWSQHPLMRLTGMLEPLKNEIEERLPDYFDYQPLHCLMPPAARLNLISAGRAVELMTRIAEHAASGSTEHIIASRNEMEIPDLLEMLGTIYDLGLIPGQPDELNAIDSLFHARLGELNLQTTPVPEAECLESYRIAGWEPAQAVFKKKSLLDAFRQTRTSQQRAKRAWEERVAAVPGRMRRKTIDRNGSQLTYLTGGEGEAPLVIVNALGHGLQYWHRLIEALMPKYRIITWELRGTFGNPGPFGLRDQVDDLEAILLNERIGPCHLVGWCTGAKIIIQFCIRNPQSVLSMICLNGAYPAPEGSEDLEMPYERGLKPLSRLVHDNPAVAPSAMRLLRENLLGGVLNPADEPDDRKLARETLAQINIGLRTQVLAPFSTEASTMNYSRQALDFWTHDTNPMAAQVQAPVLVIGSEYDKIVSPELARLVSSYFPYGKYAEIPGGTHYSFYDSPALVAGLMENFFAEVTQTEQVKP